MMPQKLTPEWRRALGDSAEEVHGTYRDRAGGTRLLASVPEWHLREAADQELPTVLIWYALCVEAMWPYRKDRLVTHDSPEVLLRGVTIFEVVPVISRKVNHEAREVTATLYGPIPGPGHFLCPPLEARPPFRLGVAPVIPAAASAFATGTLPPLPPRDGVPPSGLSAVPCVNVVRRKVGHVPRRRRHEIDDHEFGRVDQAVGANQQLPLAVRRA